ncbi:hypothetical protein BVX98_04910 [bacterium F11]|nr:hypothetical protein BVX98_04910 [bacterium F11]
MATQEKIRLILFLLFVLSIYVLAGSLVLREIGARLGFWKTKKTRLVRWVNIVVLAFAVIGILCFSYGYFIEPYWLDIRFVRVDSDKVKGSASPLRIVHLSDIHSDRKPRLEPKLPSTIEELSPDLIFFTGDTINSPKALPVFKNMLREIGLIAPTYVVRGNYDIGFWSGLDLFGDTGAVLVSEGSIKKEIRGTKIHIAGIDPFDEHLLDQAVSDVAEDEVSLFLSHYPLALRNHQKGKIDFIFSGHVHGGQVALPFYGAIITLSPHGKTYERGLYQKDGYSLYVSRGIGMEGGIMPRVRFWSRPEITVIDVDRIATTQ